MIHFKQQSQLKKNIVSGSVTAAGGIAISIVAYPIYLHFLGAVTYGLWAILNVIIYFASIGNFGIDEALVKYIAEDYDKKNIDSVKYYISTGINLLLVNGIIIIVLLLFLENKLESVLQLDPDYAALFHTLFPAIVMLSIFILLVQFVNSVLKGLGRFDQASYILFIGRICSIGISVFFFIQGYTLWGLFWGHAVSFIVVLAVSSVFIHKKIGAYYMPLRYRRDFLLRLLRFGGTMTVSKILSMLLEPLIKLIIARYLGLAEVTYFEIANKIVLQTRSLFERGISAIMPEVSRLAAAINGTQAKLSRVMNKVNKTTILVGVVVFIALFLAGELLLKAWLGQEYNPSISFALRVIICGYLVNLLSVPSYYYFMGVGKVAYCFYNHFVQTVLNCMLILVFIVTQSVTFQSLIIAYAFSVGISALMLILAYSSISQGTPLITSS